MHGLPCEPAAAAWASEADWAPFCTLCPVSDAESSRRLSNASAPTVLRTFRAACLSHVAERHRRATAAETKKSATRTLNALLKTGSPVYRCPVPDCGALSVHTACDDLRAHHLQLQSTEALVKYSETFRAKVLDRAAVQRLCELYALCASPALKRELPRLDEPHNLDADRKPLRGPPVTSNACGSCGFLGHEIGEWLRVCGDCKHASQPVHRPPWGNVCRHCGNYLG